jgi:AcrR family transcriptional regulator
MRREAMLEAARTVFAEKGYIRATLDEIAQRAEFGKGTIYNYFEGGKESLLFAIFDELYDDYYDLLTSSFAPGSVEGIPIHEVFRRLIESSLTYFWERQHLFMILIKESHRLTFSNDEDKATYFIRQHQRMVDALIPPLEEAMEHGELKPLPPHAVAHMILGSINGAQMHVCYQLLTCEPDAPETTGPMPKATADFLTTMLFEGLNVVPSKTPSGL